MGFSSVDALFNAITTSGQILQVPFTKTVMTGATSAAGRFHETMSIAGTGGAMTLTGTAGTGIVMDSTKAGAIPIGPAVETTKTKHLLYMDAITPSTVMTPAQILLTDIIHIYPSCVLVTTPSTLSNHPTWTGSGDTRMTNAYGVQASVLLTTASTAAGQLTLTYKDQDGNTAGAQAGSMYGPVAATPAGCLMAQTNATATPGGPYMTLGAGDWGVQQVSSYAINSGVTTGVGCIILHRPICTITLTAANTLTPWDFSTGPIRLPRIYDGACLGMFVQIGQALTTNQNLSGHMVFGWA